MISYLAVWVRVTGRYVDIIFGCVSQGDRMLRWYHLWLCESGWQDVTLISSLAAWVRVTGCYVDIIFGCVSQGDRMLRWCIWLCESGWQDVISISSLAMWIRVILVCAVWGHQCWLPGIRVVHDHNPENLPVWPGHRAGCQPHPQFHRHLLPKVSRVFMLPAWQGHGDSNDDSDGHGHSDDLTGSCHRWCVIMLVSSADYLAVMVWVVADVHDDEGSDENRLRLKSLETFKTLRRRLSFN